MTPASTACASGESSAAKAGRTCPVSYRYGPRVFRRAPELVTDTLYVIGGLYGNPLALDAIEALAAAEAAHGATPALLFNGDFHWFDINSGVFLDIDRRVRRHVALRGNAETELAGEDDGHGCGCGYPDAVPDDDVERSNRILSRLRQTATALSDRTALMALPMHAVVQVGAARVAVVHGDAQSLAGWSFDACALQDPDNEAALWRAFEQADVDVFACSHTCLPALRALQFAGRPRAVVNNGAAGMPNFAGSRRGVISRIARTPAPVGLPLLLERNWQVAGSGQTLHVGALAVAYDDAAWERRFLADWPPGSAAHASYFRRIQHGPAWQPWQAYGSVPDVQSARQPA